MHKESLKQQWRKLLAAAALALSLAMCAVAGQLGAVSAVSGELDGATAEARAAYIASLGWTVSPEEEQEQVTLPASFGDAYADYLAIQAECGFDLTAYAGQTVTRYSYTVTNYPTGESDIRLDLLVCQGQIVGGDVRTADLAGFMHSLVYPE
ncbi:MAG: DUF4830 domain-containing protein [Clostridiales bacterium]|nr:DUF4830 domain-containing protein [Clostridiales bacterium]